jgi:hypothetical protein
VIVWADGEQIKMSYAPPAALAARYDLGDELASRLAGVETLTDAIGDR